MSALRIAVPASLVLLSGAALAQSMGAQIPSAATDAPVAFGQLDANRDGSISPAEAAANQRLSTTFLSLDANGNGALEPSEFSRFEVPNITRGRPGAPGTSATPPAQTSTPPPMNATPPPMNSTPPPSSGNPPPR